MDRPKISVIVVNYRTPQETINSVKTIRNGLRGISHEIIIVDNDSADGSLEKISGELDGITILAMERNKGFGAANNYAARFCDGEFLWLLNSDTEYIEGNVKSVLSVLDADLAIAGCSAKLYYQDGKPQTAGQAFPSLLGIILSAMKMGDFLRSHRRLSKFIIGFFSRFGGRGAVSSYVANLKQEKAASFEKYEWITAAAMIIRRSAFNQVGGFDERVFLYYEDLDLCWRLSRLGYKFLVANELKIKHLVGTSTKKNPKLVVIKKRSASIVYRKIFPRAQFKFLKWFILPIMG